MTAYVRATEADDAEPRRMALLYAYHVVLTIEALEATGVSNGWRCLEVGARGRWHHAVASGPCRRWRIVVAVDLETHWVEPLAGEVVEVRSGDFGRHDLDRSSFDLVVAQILLLHLPEPQEACRRFVEPTAPGGQIVIHDADLTPLALADASTSELAGSRSCSTQCALRGIDLALGPKVADLLQAAGATIEQVKTLPCNTVDDGRIAAEITAITIDRFRDRAQASAWRMSGRGLVAR